MIRAVIDPALSATIVSARALHYTHGEDVSEDRPGHVRAASGLAFLGDQLLVIQDDAAFVARIAGDHVDAVALPRGAGGRRRFETALGNKLDKLDLEACLVDGDRLLAFGSGSLPGIREHVVVVALDGNVDVIPATAMYAAARDALGGVLNIEGVAHVGDELWLFHRGNTGPTDRPAVVRLPFAALRDLLASQPAFAVLRVDRYDLGATNGVRYGFTDAATVDDHVVVACAAEASPDAIDDGLVHGSVLGVVDHPAGPLRGQTAPRVRCAPVVGRDGAPLKIEGLAFGARRDRVWITIDPDDPGTPSTLCELQLQGPWWASTAENR